MAYNQQSDYGAPHRPYYDHQQPPYVPSNSDGYGYDGRDQGYDYNGRSQCAAPQGYTNAPEPQNNSYGYAHAEYDDDPALYHRNDAYYEGRNHGERGQRLPGQPPQPKQRQPERGAYNGHHDRGPRHSPSRPQAGFQQQQRDQYYEPREEHRPHDHRQQYDRAPDQRNGYGEPANSDYTYNSPYEAPRQNWQQNQSYEPPVHGHYEQQPPNNHPHPVYPAPHSQAQPQAGRRDGRSPNRVERNAPRDNQNHSQSGSGNLEKAKQAKSPKRIIEDINSPDTVAWDNPFPTFPTKPKKSAQSDPKSLNGAVADMNLKDDSRQDKALDSRPQMTNSKGSYGSACNVREEERGHRAYGDSNAQHDNFQDGLMVVPPGQHGEYMEHQSQPPKDAQAYIDPAQGRSKTRENGHSGTRRQDLSVPIAQGRHSEDNRTRPFIPAGEVIDSGYERSRTMPTAVSNAVAHPDPQKGYSDQSNWQEPGAVAGYHGPEDKGFIPNGSGSTTQQRPQIQQRSQSYDTVSHHDKARASPPKVQPRHVQFPQDSLGELFDTYYDGAQEGYHPYVHGKQPGQRSPGEEELPNFDAAFDNGANHRRGMTIDDHLQPQRAPQPLPPLPVQDRHRHQHREQRRPRIEPHQNGAAPRSRSQPDLKDRHSPRQQQGNGFDFGVAVAADGRPATDSSRGNRGPHGNQLGSFPKDRQNRSRPQNAQRPVLAPGQRPIGNRSNETSPVAYEDPAHNRPYRSAPLQDGRPRDDQMRRPGGRPSPTHRTDGNAPPTKHSSNPDKLPHHPAPVRPGLMEGSHLNQVAKPPPVRQYNAAPSPMQLSNPGQQSGPARPAEDSRGPGPVTLQELENLRQATIRKPDDQATHLVLAKKLVEAAAVLVDERADQRTRAKSREKYIGDACRIVKKLSSNGYVEASFYLADCYSRGALGLEADVKEAFLLYQSAAKAGHAQAAYRVAVCCEMGQEEGGGTKRDAVKAIQWYKRAATLGDAPAMYKMGIIQLKGLLGQPKNPKDAVTWLKRAAERADRENPHALHELGLLHEKPNSDSGIIKDEAYSKQLFTQAANLGYKFSQFRLGCAYEYGLMGCPVDPRQSIAWYSKAAVQEEHQSELALSGWYLTGSEGVLQQSDTEAYLWARKAAQAGLAKAEYAMGYFTEVGIGAPANLEDAKRWYWRSASQNFPKARDRLEDLRKGGSAKQKTRVSRSNMKKQSDGECIVM